MLLTYQSFLLKNHINKLKMQTLCFWILGSSRRWILHFWAVMTNKLEVSDCFNSSVVFGNGPHTSHLSRKSCTLEEKNSLCVCQTQWIKGSNGVCEWALVCRKPLHHFFSVRHSPSLATEASWLASSSQHFTRSSHASFQWTSFWAKIKLIVRLGLILQLLSIDSCDHKLYEDRYTN